VDSRGLYLKYGSGARTNFSQFRGGGEKISGGGTSSGLMSFLKIGNRKTGTIKSVALPGVQSKNGLS